ncbi:uncharacterized protein [Apostichopus japonicus]|uniref:uncharacterized protein n=1 Tax=Stichopus japonicus TaxID=307972 RepID=UPI003AB543DB
MAVKFLFAGVIFIISSLVTVKLCACWRHMGLSIPSCVLYLVTGLLALIGILVGCALIFISTRRTSKHHTLLSALHHFIVKYHRLYVGSRMLKKFRAACKNPREAQELLLQKIIKTNKNTDYGHQFRLGEIHSLEDLRQKHPITDYDHYRRFIIRLSKGEKDVLTAEKVSRLILTSGTTGTGKMIPQDENIVDNFLILLGAFQHEMFPDMQPMQSFFRLHVNAEIKQSECGITKASATALEKHMMKGKVDYATPSDGFLIDTVYEAFYVHLLFALREEQLGSAFITFASILIDLMKFLETNWPKLVHDLSKGTLHQDLKLSPQMRATLTRALGSGDHERAMKVKEECEKGFDGIIKRLWPDVQVISAIDNIGIRSYMKSSFGKGIEIYSAMYISSEAFMGLNLWPFEDGTSEYALNLTENVFEFIKEEDMDKPNPKTYFVDEVEVGQKYELVLSQKYGFYRYRLGDLVKVTGFYQNSPKISFLYRKASILNLVGEKVDQHVIHDSLSAALNPWKDQVEMKHYTCAENVLVPEQKDSQKPGLYYVFFLELKSNFGDELPDDLNTEILAEVIQKNLYERHEFYRVFHNTKQITIPTVYLTKEGAFTELKEYILANSSASRAQFKMPLKLRTRDMAEVLLEHSLP